MKIKLSKSQWEGMGKKAGWMNDRLEGEKALRYERTRNPVAEEVRKTLNPNMVYKGTLCPKCKHPEHTILNPSNPIINECVNCKHRWNPDNEKAKETLMGKEAQGRMNRNEEETYPTTGKPIAPKDADTLIQTEHISKMQKMLHAIDLAIPCLEDWTDKTGFGETFRRDMKALSALKESIKDVEHLRGHGFPYLTN